MDTVLYVNPYFHHIWYKHMIHDLRAIHTYEQVFAQSSYTQDTLGIIEIFFKKSILLFGKDILNWSKVTIK